MSEDNNKDLTFAEIIAKINEQLQISDNSFSKPTIDELNQFQKTWFYHNWDLRFRKLASYSALGTRGAIAIPNTTFEEWLYWFHEWAIHFADDYNEFKKLVYQAIKLLEKHMEVIDKRLTAIEDRLTEIEKELKDIYNKIAQINKDIANLQERVTHLENDLQTKYNELLEKHNNNVQRIAALEWQLQQIVNNLKASGAMNSNGTMAHNIAYGNINLFGGSTDGGSYIRSNNGRTENDITAGI